VTVTWQVRTELQLAGVWTDVSSLVYARDRVVMSRGRRSEGSTADAQALACTMNNRSGNLSMRNPTGTWYGKLTRNTPIRTSLPAASSWLSLTALGRYASCPDSVPLSITGDLDFRVDLWANTWFQDMDLGGKFATTGNQRSWALQLNANGTVRLSTSPDGTTVIDHDSTVPLPIPVSGRKAIRATLQVNNGSGGHTVTFYTSDTIGGTWTQLGAAVVTAGTTSLFDSTATLLAGDLDGGKASFGVVRYYGLRVYQGIAGTLRASPDFTAQADGAASFTDAQGNVWTPGGGGALVARDYRFAGEVPEWPTQWDVTGTDVYVPISAAGPMRRLGQGAKALRSAYYRGCTSPVRPVTGLVGYWPMEDGAGSTQFAAAGVPGVSAGGWIGTPKLAADSASFACSAPLSTVEDAMVSFTPAGYTAGAGQARVLLSIPAAGTTNNAVLMRVVTTGSASRWELVYQTGGNLVLNVYSASGASLLSTVPGAFGVNGVPLRLSLSLAQSGGNINWTFSTLAVGGLVGLYTSNTLASQTMGYVKRVDLNPSRAMSGVTMGHLTVQSAVTSLWDLNSLLVSWAGETACARVTRLAGEEGLAVLAIGDTPNAVPLGPQRQDTLLNILRETETTDGGVLYELRDQLGFGYRSLASLLQQPAALTLNYTTADLSAFSPVEDDQAVRNQVTASRPSGSSATVSQDTGTLSTLAPPNGVNVYDTSVTVNPESDGFLQHIAGWAVRLGTVDEPRFPALGLNLARTNYTGSPAVLGAAAALEPGDRLDVLHPPAWMPPDTIRLQVVGSTEALDQYRRELTLVCRPETAFVQVGVYDDGVSRYSPDGSTLAGTMTTGATSVSVSCGNSVWTTTDVPVQIVVAGEVMTVGTIAGAGPTQTFSNITRSVNGVVKVHAAGEAVALASPVYYAL